MLLLVQHRVRACDNAKEVTVLMEYPSQVRAEALPSLRATMARAGTKGELHVQLLEEVESRSLRTRERGQVERKL